ncbi:MAG: sigma-70 family RNA polymerase sigma factor [Pseudomonadota bacterium]
MSREAIEAGSANTIGQGQDTGLEEIADARLRAIFDANFVFIWRSLRRLGVPEASVDDAAQEVFIIATRKLSRIQEGRERSFLYSTARRVASGCRRASRREAAAVEAVDVQSVPDSRPGPDDAVDQQQARKLLDAVLAEMSLDIRSVFVLFELEGMSMAEIAAMLDVAPGTVASRLRRARELFHRLVGRLEEQGLSDGRPTASS